MINSITFIFSRISTEGSEPLISMLLIDPVSDDLNGTEVNCTEVLIITLSEEFEREIVTVCIELIEFDLLYS